VGRDDKDENKKDTLRSIPFLMWIAVSFALLFYGAADQQRYWICGLAMGSFVLGFGLLMLTSRESRKQHPFVAVTSTVFGASGIILTILYHFGSNRTRELLVPVIIVLVFTFFAYMLIGSIIFEIRKRNAQRNRILATGHLIYDKNGRELGLDIRKLLRDNNLQERWEEISTFRFNDLPMGEKEVLLDEVINKLNSYEFKSLSVAGVGYDEWIKLLKEYSDYLRIQKNILRTELHNIKPKTFVYNGKTYDLKKNVCTCIATKGVYVFLLQEDGNYFDDNLVAVDRKGHIKWSSRERIDVKNRFGACFIYLGADRQNKDYSQCIFAYAFVGIDYVLDPVDGKVIDKMFIK